jgi:hypothetical protein
MFDAKPIPQFADSLRADYLLVQKPVQICANRQSPPVIPERRASKHLIPIIAIRTFPAR